MADIETKGTETAEAETVENIIGSSLESESPEDVQLQEIVKSTLDKIIAITRCSDLSVNDAVDLIMPKVKCELYLKDLNKDITYMTETLNTCMKQMQVVDQDIAEIYLDLHNIYKKLERSDDGSRRLSSANRERLLRRVQESEDLQKRSRHYLTNDAKELSAMLVELPQEPNEELN